MMMIADTTTMSWFARWFSKFLRLCIWGNAGLCGK